MKRTAKVNRKTLETEVTINLNLDGNGLHTIDTGLGFFDHMLASLAVHACWDLELTCQGDLQVDDHHTVEDCALTLGEAFNQALGKRQSITRFGWAMAPLDEALGRAAIDLASRPYCDVDLQLKREVIGTISCENLEHFIHSFAMAGQFCCHLDILKGKNDHHRAEAGFKSLALALRMALSPTDQNSSPSTKGVL